MDKIRADGVVIKEHKGCNFKIELDETQHLVACTLSGKMRTRQIKICAGDRVAVEISPYDLEKGRIVWRYT